MAYNCSLGAAPPGNPSPSFAPARRPIGGRHIGRGRIKFPDGRTIQARAPGTPFYVPGYLDDASEASLGLAIPLAPVIGLVGGLFGGGADKKKMKDRTARLNEMTAKAYAGDAAALAVLDQMATGYGGNWGSAYNSIKNAAKKVAAAVRAKLSAAGSTPPTAIPAPSAAPVAPPPVTLMPTIPGVTVAPVTYQPDAPPAAAPVATASAGGGGFDLSQMALPIGLGLAALLVLPKLMKNPPRRRRRSRR